MKTIKSVLALLVFFGLATALSSCGGGGGGSDGMDDGSGNPPPDDRTSILHQVCTTIIDLQPGMNVKYKSQNVHGGRGPSFIVGCGAKQYWPPSTYLATFPVYSILGNEIGRFVNYDPGHKPYGNRSYTGLPGGYPADSSTLKNSALADGSTEIFINPKDSICFKVNDPDIDQGSINAIWGEGNCP